MLPSNGIQTSRTRNAWEHRIIAGGSSLLWVINTHETYSILGLTVELVENFKPFQWVNVVLAFNQVLSEPVDGCMQT